MTIFFISRQPGAVAWAGRQGVRIDRRVAHLDPAEVSPGDTVAGTLPVHLAAGICARGARYLHLALDAPERARGSELTADELGSFGARLEPCLVERFDLPAPQPRRRTGMRRVVRCPAACDNACGRYHQLR